MKWEKCTLINPEITGEDKLHNEIKADKAVKTVYGRFTPFDETDIAIDGRIVSKNCRKLLIRHGLAGLPPFKKIEIGKAVYDVNEITSLGRFALAYLEKTKE